jgi:hypothetical protein
MQHIAAADWPVSLDTAPESSVALSLQSGSGIAISILTTPLIATEDTGKPARETIPAGFPVSCKPLCRTASCRG